MTSNGRGSENGKGPVGTHNAASQETDAGQRICDNEDDAGDGLDEEAHNADRGDEDAESANKGAEARL